MLTAQTNNVHPFVRFYTFGWPYLAEFGQHCENKITKMPFFFKLNHTNKYFQSANQHLRNFKFNFPSLFLCVTYTYKEWSMNENRSNLQIVKRWQSTLTAIIVSHFESISVVSKITQILKWNSIDAIRFGWNVFHLAIRRLNAILIAEYIIIISEKSAALKSILASSII